MSELSPALYRAGSGEPVLLLHGFTGSWHHWRPVLADLVARYEVIAPTLAGHDGGKPLPPGTAMSFAASADLLEEHLDELGLGTVHAVGNSMGGALALELAKRGRARSVVALAPAGGYRTGDGEAPRLARFFSRQLRLMRANRRRLPILMRRPASRRILFRDVMRHGELVAPADAMQLVSAAIGCSVAAAAIEALRRDSPELVLSDLEQIDCPVRIASPAFDRILPVARHAPRYRREIPGVDALVLPGCGHVPMWDDATLVVRTISEFVDRHAPGTVAGAVAEPLAR
ncbi:MAG: alpha/beta fold hydrolase [Solirubrobacteraceae bacterium]